jgi:mannose-1-phosphate guanylyltransferase
MSIESIDPHSYALILAGGSGQRFWPWSRDKLPKQLLPLFHGKCLLRLTLDRLSGLIPPSRILVLTSDSQLSAVRAVLPELPEANLIAEPCRRDTAAAITLGIGIIESRDADAVVAVLPSDQLILDDSSFQADLKVAMSSATEQGEIVVIGIPPSAPSSAFGYLQVGPPNAVIRDSSTPLHQVRRFIEKPKMEVASAMLAEGGYLWNAGIFVLSTSCFRRQVELCAPWLCELLDRIRTDYGHLSAAVRNAFETVQRTSFDYAVMEKAVGVLVVQARFDWNDLGTWASYTDQLARDADGNAQSGPAPVLLNSHRNVVIGTTPQRVALLGVEGLVVVVTGDAILIADAAKMDHLKTLVDLLPEALR